MLSYTVDIEEPVQRICQNGQIPALLFFWSFFAPFFTESIVSTHVTDIHAKFYTFVQFLLLLFLSFIHSARTLSHSYIALFPSSEYSQIGSKYACQCHYFDELLLTMIKTEHFFYSKAVVLFQCLFSYVRNRYFRRVLLSQFLSKFRADKVLLPQFIGLLTRGAFKIPLFILVGFVTFTKREQYSTV